MDDELTRDADGFVASKDAFRAYEAWCEANAQDPMTKVWFGRALGERGFADDRHYIGGKRVRGFKGIALKESVGQ